MTKRKAHSDRSSCVSCGACVCKCPKAAIDIYKGCHAVVDPSECIGCGQCVNTCPANSITLSEVDNVCC